MKKIKIYFIGIGCKIIKGNFSDDVWGKFKNSALKNDLEINDAFFHSSFYNALKISTYNSWYDLGSCIQVAGLMDNYQSFIEIRINSMKIKKINISVLSNSNFLFPLYNTSLSNANINLNQKGSIIIVEKEIGKIGEFNFETNNFYIDKLHFTLQKIVINDNLNYTILSEIEYNGQQLLSKRTDALVKERYVLR